MVKAGTVWIKRPYVTVVTKFIKTILSNPTFQGAANSVDVNNIHTDSQIWSLCTCDYACKPPQFYHEYLWLSVIWLTIEFNNMLASQPDKSSFLQGQWSILIDKKWSEFIGDFPQLLCNRHITSYIHCNIKYVKQWIYLASDFQFWIIYKEKREPFRNNILEIATLHTQTRFSESCLIWNA